jgi:hypothetical protein
MSKVICRFNDIEIPMTFFTELEKPITKCIWDQKNLK